MARNLPRDLTTARARVELMAIATTLEGPADGAGVDFYQRTLELLAADGIPHLVGGAFAIAHYAGIERSTKDIDLFVKREDLDRIEGVLGSAGYRTERPYPHWLAKAWCGEHFVDLVFSSANGIATVDDEWFEHGTRGHALGLPVGLCPVEETIWSKAFIMERERFDGADIAHLIHARGTAIDWRRILRRFGVHWRVLLTHVVLFGFVYPAERDVVPAWVMEELLRRLRDEMSVAPPRDRVCGGSLLSREQYLVDVEQWGYADARREPLGALTEEEIWIWTTAIGRHDTRTR